MLNDSQKNLIEKNHMLIYSFLRDKRLEADDWYDVAAFGLIQAAVLYRDTGKVKFSTYAYKCMNSVVSNERKKIGRQKRAADTYAISIFSEQKSESGDVMDEFIDIFETPEESAEEIAIRKVTYENFLDGLSDTKLRVVTKLLFLGYGQEEISSIIGCSQSSVNRMKDKIRAHGFACGVA